MIAFLVLLLALDGKNPYPTIKPERVGHLAHEPIREASGIVKSRRYPGIFWVANDSGNPNTIFAVKSDGALVREYRVNTLNIDWEDLAIDDDGHLYIGDIGNNNGRLARRVIHQIDEPDPTLAPEPNSTLKVLKSWHYQFPKEGRFDAEGMFIKGDAIYLVSKTFDRRDAEVHAIPISAESSLFKPLTIKRVAVLPGYVDPVTGADLSSDGKTLAVCSYQSLGVYEASTDGAWKRRAIRSFHVDDQIEAICWDGRDLILAGESRGVFRVPEKDWRTDAK